MKHNTPWMASLMIIPVALMLLGGCGGTSLASHTETIEVDDLFGTNNGSFDSAGPIDPPDFGSTGPLDIVITAAKAHYTCQNLGNTAASAKLFISQKSPDQINAENVEEEAILLVNMPPEGSVPAGEVVHVEGQNILNDALKQFLRLRSNSLRGKTIVVILPDSGERLGPALKAHLDRTG